MPNHRPDLELTAYERDSMPLAGSARRLTPADRAIRTSGIQQGPLSRFRERLTYAIRRARRRDASVAVYLIDIDRFRRINECLGYEAGNRILARLCLRLRERFGDIATAAHLGGDRFALLCAGPGGEELDEIAQRLMAVISEPIRLGAHDLRLTASIGCALNHTLVPNASEQLCKAEAAMQCVKRQGGNGWQMVSCDIYDPNGWSLRDLELEGDLRAAVIDDQLYADYQPLVRFGGQDVIAVEALLRWQHPRLGHIPPSEFIPILERIRLIDKATLTLIRRGCRHLKWWEKAAGAQLRLHVNISAQQCADPHFATRIWRVLSEERIPPGRFCLEITETMAADQQPVIVQTLSTLRQMGFSIAIDDFGVGYSALSYLATLSADILKIDGSFVRNIPGGGKPARTLLSHLIELALNLDLQVVAEAVETRAQAAYLAQWNDIMGQGDFLGCPGDALAVLKRLTLGACRT